jgi:hypothetical protein
MFNLYQKYSLTSFTINNKTETERYYEYIYFFDMLSNNKEQLKSLKKDFDIDICYNYCYNNSLNFDDYKNYVLPFNSLIIYIFLLMQYSSNIIFTFWKKYNIGYNNEINNLIINANYNFYTEWLSNFNFFLNKYINDNYIKNNILDNFYNLYTLTNFNLTNDYLNLSFSNPKLLFIKLKVIFNRFYNSNNQIYFPNFQINFNDYFKIYFYNNDINNINYNLDNFKNLILNQTNNYNLLNSSFDTILPDESKNIVPVDLQNIFYLIAYDLIDSLYSNTNLCNYPQIFSFLIKVLSSG